MSTDRLHLHDGLIPAAIDVDAMDEKTAKKYCGFLMNQNMMYMFQNQDLTSEIQAARSDVALHLQKITMLQSKLLEAHLLTEQIDELKSTIILLQAENELLKAENKLLKDSLADYKTRIEVLESCNPPMNPSKAYSSAAYSELALKL